MPTTDSRPAATSPVEPLGVLPTGTLLAGFEVISVLGHGAFGITYLARDTKLDRQVAIKEYLPTSLALRQGGTTVMPRATQFADDFVWGRGRFLDEARTLAKLEGAPAVVRVIDFLEANGTAYTVMALAKGQTLDRLIRNRGPLSASDIVRLLDPLLEGIERVHKAGFLHRDIKPANIIVDDEGNPTLIDFGASRAAIAGHTAAMTAVFTPGYAAAEQFTSARQGPWTDIYGVSATLYHAITGKVPPSAFDRMLEDNYQPLARLRPRGYSPELLSGIDAGLALKASDRPQSIADWRELLRRGAPSPAPQASVATTVMRDPLPRLSPPSPPSRRQIRRWIIAAVILLFILAGGHKGRSLLFGESTPNTNAAEVAHAERQRADELATRQQAEADAKAKADADAAATRAAAETAEIALRLSAEDRQRLQIALTSLGFDTQGTDGTFGQRTRDLIAAWQTAHGQTATGFLNALQEQALLSEGAPAVKKFDEDQVKAANAAKAKAAAAASPAQSTVAQAPAAAPAAASAVGAMAQFDGVWSVTLVCPNYADAKGFKYLFNMTVKNGLARGQHGSEGVPGYLRIAGQIAADGSTTMTAHGLVGDSKTAVGGLSSGAQVHYTFPASFSGNQGTGTRTQYRPCTYTFVRQ